MEIKNRQGVFSRFANDNTERAHFKYDLKILDVPDGRYKHMSYLALRKTSPLKFVYNN